MKWLVPIAVMLVLGGCRRESDPDPTESDAAFALVLPVGFPAPDVPADNPLTVASTALGKALFFDPRLSRDGSISCASCHFPDHAFSDTTALSGGVDGQLGMRNAPSLANVAYHRAFFRDGGVPTLEQQVIAPIHDEVEMDHNINQVATALRYQEPYNTLAMKAFGEPLNAWNLSRAIACYERTLISGWSRYDRYMQGEQTALSDSEIRGMVLFNNDELNYTACHNGHDLNDHDYHNIGLYLTYADVGRERITLDPADNGRFKTPTLRNIARTGPYMHDGSMSTMEQVIDHFASGGLPHVNRDPEMRTFDLSPEQKLDLIAFLNALTDERTIDQVP